jgi:hypothetical protein
MPKVTLRELRKEAERVFGSDYRMHYEHPGDTSETYTIGVGHKGPGNGLSFHGKTRMNARRFALDVLRSMRALGAKAKETV